MDEDFWDLVINRNLETTFLMTKAVLPHMSDGGAIISFHPRQRAMAADLARYLMRHPKEPS